MGGNALKNTETGRLSSSEYFEVAKTVSEIIAFKLPKSRVAVIPAYANKESFGDLDIMVSTDELSEYGGWDFIKQLVVSEFNATDMFKNSDVFSFDFRHTADQTTPGFQVDIIGTSRKYFDFSLSYMSYNDLGNLIGRVAHSQGFSFGHSGLIYHIRDGNYKFDTIPLTLDFRTALVFLGFNPDTYYSGFNDLTDIYQYVAESRYFNSSIFLLENRNHRSRVRDQKRSTYTGFLKWCENETDGFIYPDNKEVWLAKALTEFSDFAALHEEALTRLSTARKVKEKFNGGLVMEWTGLAGSDLGMLMIKLKNEFDTVDQMQKYMLLESPINIKAFVLSHHTPKSC
jgi:hypothetical protein